MEWNNFTDKYPEPDMEHFLISDYENFWISGWDDFTLPMYENYVWTELTFPVKSGDSK